MEFEQVHPYKYPGIYFDALMTLKNHLKCIISSFQFLPISLKKNYFTKGNSLPALHKLYNPKILPATLYEAPL